jgi:hypothetical protein
VFWIKKTIRKVTIVVPVLMISCQVSEKWNIGPLIAHPTMTITAMINAHDEPTICDVFDENFRNRSFIGQPPRYVYPTKEYSKRRATMYLPEV